MNKLLPEIVELKKELEIDILDVEETFRINSVNEYQFKMPNHSEGVRRMEWTTYDVKTLCTLLCETKNTMLILNFATSCKSTYEKLVETKKTMVEIIKMPVSYKKILLTEKTINK